MDVVSLVAGEISAVTGVVALGAGGCTLTGGGAPVCAPIAAASGYAAAVSYRISIVTGVGSATLECLDGGDRIPCVASWANVQLSFVTNYIAGARTAAKLAIDQLVGATGKAAYVGLDC